MKNLLKKPPLLALLLFVTACHSGSESKNDLRALSNGPELPEQCDICWVDFEACVNAGFEIQACEDAAIACASLCDAPPPPASCEHCFAGYEACVEVAEQGMADMSDCVAGLESCLYSCEVPQPEPCSDGSECPPEPCEDETMDCPEPPYCEVVDDSGQCWGSCDEYCSDKCFGGDPQNGSSGNACSSEMYMECLAECGPTLPTPDCETEIVIDPNTGDECCYEPYTEDSCWFPEPEPCNGMDCDDPQD